MFVTLRNFFSSTVYFSSRLEAADPTNAWRLFPPVFRKGRMKGQDGMTVTCHAMHWTENSNEHPKTRDQQKYDKSHKTGWFDQDHHM